MFNLKGLNFFTAYEILTNGFKSYLFLFTMKWFNNSLYKLFKFASLTVLLIVLGTVRSISSVNGLNCDSKNREIEDTCFFRNQTFVAF